MMISQVNPQPTDAHIRISHDIHRELIRRKFTQRQRDIIDFILTLSWGCGKPSAVIPMLKHFELCGIRRGHIRKELTILVEKKIVIWDESINVFQINKHYDLWLIELVEQFNAKSMNELIKLNIDTHTPNLYKVVTEKVIELPKKELNKVTEKVTRLQKRELFSYTKGNCAVTKKVILKREYPSHIKQFQLSKTMFKAIIKKRTTTTTATNSVQNEFSFPNVFKAYENNFIAGNKLTPFDVEEFGILFDDFGGEWLLEAMREAYRHDKKNLAYVHGILKGYKSRGGIGSVETEVSKPLKPIHLNQNQQSKTKQQQELDDLRRRAEEERKREQSRSI